MTSTEMPADSSSLSEHVIEAIANHVGVDPLELEVPLGEVIDPDALNSIFTSPFDERRHSGTLEFAYESYRVTVVSEPEASVSVDVTSLEEQASVDSAVGVQGA